MNRTNHILGIDIGGTGIKMAMTDVSTGELLTERFKDLTPKPATPENILQKIKEMIQLHFYDYKGIIGIGFPSIIRKGICVTAANIDLEWVGLSINDFFTKGLGLTCYTGNDADVAGMAEYEFGIGQLYTKGLAIFLTVGTGIGSALFYNGELIPNSELGHLYYKGLSYEKFVSNSTREKEELDWEEWANRFNNYLKHLTKLFSPELFIIGGGIAKKKDLYIQYFDKQYEVKTASLKNAAGVIGASMYAYKMAYLTQKRSYQNTAL